MFETPVEQNTGSSKPPQPVPVDVLAEMLQRYKDGHGRWPYKMPADVYQAADWWIGIMQEPRWDTELDSLVQTRTKGSENGKWYWKTPYLDRLRINLHRYCAMSFDDQQVVYGCMEEGVRWRGEPVDLLYKNNKSIYSETMRYRETNTDEYKSDARNKTRSVLTEQKL